MGPLVHFVSKMGPNVHLVKTGWDLVSITVKNGLVPLLLRPFADMLTIYLETIQNGNIHIF